MGEYVVGQQQRSIEHIGALLRLSAPIARYPLCFFMSKGCHQALVAE
jgi:hypothetical protein